MFKVCLLSVLLAFLSFNSTYAQLPNDCEFAIIVCGNSNVNNNASGVGSQELTNSNSCDSQETNSVWLQVLIETSGTLGFILTPESSSITVDYDFFVFGPNASCNNLGQAIRCNTTNPQAANQGNNLTGMNGNETQPDGGPGPDGNSFVQWLNVTSGESYFIVIDRPVGSGAFSLEWVGSATFPESPESQTSTEQIELSECDNLIPFDDGISQFDLNSISADIIGIQTNVALSFHSTESDANIGANSIGPFFTNTANPQTIYARLRNTNTGCFITQEILLSINPGPPINDPTPFDLCDDGADGDVANGQTVFNFQIKTDEITDGINATNYLISYHNNQTDAENNINALPSLFYNPNITPYEVYVRVQDQTNVDCISYAPFFLNAYPPPTANGITIYQCDEDGINDGLTTYVLNQHSEEISDGVSGSLVSYFLTETDALSNNNPIDGEFFNNSTSPQTIFALVSNSNTDCDNIVEIVLGLSQTHLPDTVLTSCDDDGVEDGLYNFDLSLSVDPIIDGLPTNLELTFFWSYQDALLESNPIDTSGFANTTPYEQSIFVRSDLNSSCYSISKIDLVVYELPNIETEHETLYCLNNAPETITLTGEIIDDLPNNYFYEWSTGETTSEIEVNEPGTYSVAVSNTNGCSKTRQITVAPSNIATIDNIQISDASINNTITVLANGEGNYEYALDNSFGPYQESNIFENVPIGIHNIYVRDTNGCGLSSEEVSVIGFPKFFTPNADDVNRFWQIKGVSEQFQPNSEILIFDRSGRLLTKLNPLSVGWDGTFNGNPLPSSDYWFSVTLQDGRRFNGHFALVR